MKVYFFNFQENINIKKLLIKNMQKFKNKKQFLTIFPGNICSIKFLNIENNNWALKNSIAPKLIVYHK